MADPAVAPINTPSRNSIGIFDVVVEGRVQEINQPRDSEYTYYALQLKAENEYSHPRIIQVSQPASERHFAKEDEIVRLKCKVSGYARNAKGMRFITNTLNFVEVL
jgi:hypothetical protein